MNKHIFPNLLLPFGAALTLLLGGCVTLHNHYAEDPNAATTTSRSVAATHTVNHTADCNCNHQHNVSYSDAATQRCEHGYYYGGVHHPTPPIYRDERDYRSYDYSNNYPWRYGSHEPYVIYVPTAPQPNRNDEPARRTDAGGNNGGSQPQDGVQSQPRRIQEPIYRAQRPEVLPTVNDGRQSEPRHPMPSVEEPTYRAQRPEVLPTVNDGRQSEPRRPMPNVEEPTYRAQRPEVLPTVNDGRQSEPRRPMPSVEEPTYRAQRPEVLPTVNDGRQSEPRRPMPSVEEPIYRAQRPEVLPTVNDGRQSEPRRTVPVVDTPPQHTSQPSVVPTVVTGPTSQPRRFEQNETPMHAQQPTVRPEAAPVTSEESQPRRVVVVPVKAEEVAAPAVVEQAPIESTVRVEKQATIPDTRPDQSQKSEKVIDSSVSTTVATPRAFQAMPVEQGSNSSVRRVVPR